MMAVADRFDMTLDLLLWRHFGREGAGMVEAALALNPGLASLGVALPPGTEVTLPEQPLQVKRLATVKLWD